MATFVGIICGLIIGWLLMVNYDTSKRLYATVKELEQERQRLVEAQTHLADTARELAICSAPPFGVEYIPPYSLFAKN